MPRQAIPTHETEREIFPTRLRDLMEENNTTQEKLGKAIGVRRQTISLYMTGQSNPDWTYIAAIARYFGVTADYLIGLQNCRCHENASISEETGLSEDAIRNIKELFGKTHAMIGPSPEQFDDIAKGNARLYLDVCKDVSNAMIPSEYNARKMIEHFFSNVQFGGVVLQFIKLINTEYLYREFIRLQECKNSGTYKDRANAFMASEKIRETVSRVRYETEQMILGGMHAACNSFISANPEPIAFYDEKSATEYESSSKTQFEYRQLLITHRDELDAIFALFDWDSEKFDQFFEKLVSFGNAVTAGMLAEDSFARWLNRVKETGEI